MTRLGFALTQHCNLRCPHCIRDDVTSVAELDVDLVLRVLREARDRFGTVEAGFTGGEPLLHREWARLIEGLRAERIPYTFVSNGWHMKRFVPLLDRHPPTYVRLSLSGADESVHDEERGRDSFRRVLLATAILTLRRVPVTYSIIVDRRTRHQLEEALDLAMAMGCAGIHYILPQPVPASADRCTDLPPDEWWAVRDELDALAARGTGGTRLVVDYGAPTRGPQEQCESKSLRRIYIDVHGRLSTCCQLSEYGATASDVVADLNVQSFGDAYAEHERRIAELERISQSTGPDDPLDAFPCMRCARATGKLGWLEQFDHSPWAFAAISGHGPSAALVPLTYSRRARRVAARAVVPAPSFVVPAKAGIQLDA